MFPWVYEFRWTPHHLMFLGIFFSVVAVIAATVGRAFRRSAALARSGRTAGVAWHAGFEDLPESARRCRHELSGEVVRRVCPNAFGCSSCALHPVLLARVGERPRTGGDSAGVGGVTLPLDRMYHRGHAWLKEEPDGTALIGPDGFISRILGTVDSVRLPARGERLAENGKAVSLFKAGREYEVLSPASGEVVDAGTGATADEPGWWIRIRPAGGRARTVHLLRGREVEPWLVRELERVQRACSAARDGAGTTLADGGELLPELGGQIPPGVMDALRAELLLND